jgi:hypothetical protein
MLEGGVNYFSLADCPYHFFGELVPPIDDADHIRADILVHKLLDNSLSLPFGLWLFDDDICLYFLVEHVRLGLVEHFYLIGLHVMEVEFFGDDVVVDLQSEVAVEAFLLLILNRSVHYLLGLEVLLRVLDGPVLEEFEGLPLELLSNL